MERDITALLYYLQQRSSMVIELVNTRLITLCSNTYVCQCNEMNVDREVYYVFA